jgi:dihydroorotase
LSSGPASILGLDEQGSLDAGSRANLVVFDPKRRWKVDSSKLRSKSRNTPFDGRELTGRVLHTFFRGAPTIRESRLIEGVLV